MSIRTVRVNELVQREISEILRRSYQSESVAMTVTEVRVSPDLRDARVFVSVIGDAETATAKMRWLKGKSREIRNELGRRIVLKFMPKIEYVLDDSLDRGVRITRIIDQLPPA